MIPLRLIVTPPPRVLRREVITDPAQIQPIEAQVRSVLPWWRRWFGL